jgi:ABC-type polysaccharide/polyol phosphate export permease
MGMMVVYTVFFSLVQPNHNIRDYPVLLLCGMLPWSFCMDSVLQATDSIVGDAQLIKKVYFPREILPLSVVLSNLVSFAISLPIFFGLALALQSPLTWWILLLPVTLLIQLIFVLGLSLILATLNVLYRDTRHLLGVVMQAWFFLTPVFYPIQTVPAQVQFLGTTLNAQLWLRRLNPMASIIASYRDLLYWGQPTGFDFLMRTAVTALVVLVVGYLVFLRYSPRFGESV